MITLRDLFYFAMFFAVGGAGYYIGYHDCKEIVMETFEEMRRARKGHK